MISREFKSNQEMEVRLRDRLALARQSASPAGPCPDPNEMAAFMQGTLDLQREAALEAHLAVCHECHEECLMMLDLFETASFQKGLIGWTKHQLTLTTEVIRQAAERLRLWFGLTIHRINRWWMYSALTAAAAICLLLIVQFTTSPDFAELIRISYPSAMLVDISAGLDPADPLFRLPWEVSESDLGFAPIQMENRDVTLAFGAGLWSARKELIGGRSSSSAPDFAAKDWAGTPQADSYWLGRWSYLLRAAALSDQEMPSDFWQEQRKILADFNERLNKLYPEKKDERLYRQVNRCLNRIGTKLGRGAPDNLTRRDRVELSQELKSLIDCLSPYKI